MMASLMAGAAASIRIPSIVLFVNLLIVFIYLQNIKLKHRQLLITPCLLILLAWSFYNYYNHGVFTVFMRSGVTLMGNTIHLLKEGVDTKHGRIIDYIAQNTAHFKTELNSSYSFEEREEIKERHYAITAYAREEFKPVSQQIEIYLKENIDDICTKSLTKSAGYKICRDNFYKYIGFVSIKSDPLGYLKRVGTNWLAYWYETHSTYPLKPWEFLKRYTDTRGHIIAQLYHFELKDLKEKYPVLSSKLKSQFHFYYHFLETKVYKKIRIKRIFSGLNCIVSLLALFYFLYSSFRFLFQNKSINNITIAVGCLSCTILLLYIMMSMSHHAITRYVNITEILAVSLTLLAIKTFIMSISFKSDMIYK
jgi:hypothetical protein